MTKDHTPQSSSFLEYNFDKKYMMYYEEIAILCFVRNLRFVEQDPLEIQIKNYLSKFFNSYTEFDLVKTGLNFVYNKIKVDIIDKNIIGLILYGAYNFDFKDSTILCNYLTHDNKNIQLTLGSICQNIIKKFDIVEIEKYCKKTNNYNIYEKDFNYK